MPFAILGESEFTRCAVRHRIPQKVIEHWDQDALPVGPFDHYRSTTTVRPVGWYKVWSANQGATVRHPPLRQLVTALVGCALTTTASALPADSATAGGSTDANQIGADAFRRVCAECHEHAVARAPPVANLRFMSSGTIYRALSSGAMKLQAQNLSDEQKRAVAEYLAGRKVGASSGTGTPLCPAAVAKFDYGEPPPFQSWGLTVENTRFIPADVSRLSGQNVGTLRLKWAMSFADALRVRSQPSLAAGALFVGSQDGTVYALDRETGCARWTFTASAEVRTGIVVSPWKAGDRNAQPLVYFGDLVGNVYALNAVTGLLVWKDHADVHPSATLTATPVLYQGQLYVPVSSLEEASNDPHYTCCTFRGSLIAYDARTGKRAWQTFMADPSNAQGVNSAGAERMGPSGAAIWGSPSIDERRRQIYLATGDNYSDPPTKTSDAVMALDLQTGKIKWMYQALAGDVWNLSCVSKVKALCPSHAGPDYDFAAATILTTAGGRDVVLAGQKSGWVFAIDPASGHLLWKTRVGRGGVEGGVHFGMAVDGERLFVPINDMTDVVYGVTYPEPARPGVYALDVSSGRIVWQHPTDGRMCKGRPLCTGGISAAVATTAGLVLTGSIDGWLRFYDATSGQEIWRYDTTQSVRTVGGGTTTGGSIAGAVSPIAYHGMVIAVSGYDFSGKMAGNVLLVFETANAVP